MSLLFKTCLSLTYGAYEDQINNISITLKIQCISVECVLTRLAASASFRGCGSSYLRACYQMICVEVIFKGWWTPVIGKFLTTEIADNGVAIYSSVREFKTWTFRAAGPSSVFSSASILFQRKWHTGSKGTIEERLICVIFSVIN